ncbi:asparaginase (plasmid) [Agrobacterium leguminum]|uniref:L-asparaginase 2 n=1 Tax=Agrobacterium deltaense NCPPB 1641 TaxID=1183425 RepID=A0A1S7UBJ9_9HYPH|nr:MULTISPECIES: asparaginase [Agrobacterium]WFS69666.1 asparaginase [Agrobacterium leguminum]CVI63748.1 L-asparaginase 2 [Agrobacterium deltaense NCPPB 1641]
MKNDDILPHIAVVATGGTIAGSGATRTQMTGYKAGSVMVENLIASVPEIGQIANIHGEQFLQIGSNEITAADWIALARRVNELVSKTELAGVVITHGTGTLEETAFFLNLVIKSEKPVVLVGSMRPATALSADGPLNLLNAVQVAADRKASGRGVLVVMNNEINGARDVTKSSTMNVAAFRSPDMGCLGYIVDGKVAFYRDTTRRHTGLSEFSLSEVSTLPYVKIIYGHAGDDRLFIDAAIADGVEGLIYAGSGNAAIPIHAEAGLIDARKAGLVVVRSSRAGSGPAFKSIPRWDEGGFLKSDTLSPHKARILLMLALSKTKDPEEIQRIFDEY